MVIIFLIQLDLYRLLRYNANIVNNVEKKKNPTSIRLSDTAEDLWEKLSKYLGISKQGVLEQALRKLARLEGIRVTGDEDVVGG